MRRLALALVVAVLVPAAIVAGSAARSSTTAAACSKAAASKAMTSYGIGVIKPYQPKAPVYQVLCGPFLGPGSQAMVGSIAIPSCGGSVDWAVFRYAGGSWKLVMNVKHGAFLDAVGSDIREMIGVLAPGDAHCFPSSVKYRFWHWNGSSLKAGPWARAASFDSILTPDKQTWCKFDVYPTPEARCAVRNPVHTAKLHKDGAFTSCDGSGCLQNWDDRAHVVAWGQANEWNAFHCLVEQKGVTCTVIGGKAAGHGFLINASGVTPVSP
jgi:hypothetical protein